MSENTAKEVVASADIAGEAMDNVSMDNVSSATALPLTDKRATFQKKSSSADLQSRLKSRKLLGVGATDDGLDIHRSKVSQILGHNESMLAANREPIYWLLKWNWVLSAMLLFCAIWSLLSPGSYSWIVFGGTHSINMFYSSCLFSMSLPLMSMSNRLIESSTQTLTLIALEISLIVHLLGAYFGGAMKSTLILLVIATVNGAFMLVTNADAPKSLLSYVRRLSHSRESNIMSSSDKKNK